MKISCITISNNTIQSFEQMNIIKYLDEQFLKLGLEFNSIHSINNNFDSLSKVYSSLDEELLFVIGGDSRDFNFEIINNFNIIFNDELIEFDECIQHFNNINYVFDTKDILFPSKSFPLIDDSHQLLGFLYKNNSKVIIFLPEKLDLVQKIYISHVNDILNNLYKMDNTNTIIKLYGINNIEILKTIDDLMDNKDSIKFIVKSHNLDSTIIIKCESYNNRYQLYVSEVVTRLKKYIYTTNDLSIYSTAVDIIKLSKKSIYIAESITEGHFTKSMLDNNKSNIQIESRVYSSINSAIEKLNIAKSSDIISPKIIGDISSKIYEEIDYDILVSIMGYFDKNLEKYIGYISICDDEGIHIYKSVVSGNKGDIIDILSKAGAFYLIKKIKENSLLF